MTWPPQVILSQGIKRKLATQSPHSHCQFKALYPAAKHKYQHQTSQSDSTENLNISYLLWYFSLERERGKMVGIPRDWAGRGWCWSWRRWRRRGSRGWGGGEVGAGTVWLVHHANTAHSEPHQHWDKETCCSLSGKYFASLCDQKYFTGLSQKIFQTAVSRGSAEGCSDGRVRERGQGRVMWPPGLPLAPSRHLTSSWPQKYFFVFKQIFFCF